jgi:hypothetical protein
MTDQTDRELLELAAKAAGIKGSLIGSAAPSVMYESDGVAIYWNPLTRSADALDLAVKLQMVISVAPHNSFAGSRLGYASSDDRDHYAATRRAIVRAAAAIAQNGAKS